ncbi:unnamed protein product [Linum trigynum]|uniref:Transposase-associated domain-containing protein n=1 Tax=Linum trigynum TaxID=586398 RepID=A0AAV2D854_9ROSI
MDKSWMKKHRTSVEFKDGVQLFLDYAFRNVSHVSKVLCPCVKCANVYAQTYDDIQVHLICDGILRGYTTWVFHGKTFQASDVATSSSSMTNVSNMGVERVSIPIQSNPPMRADLRGLLRDVFRREDLVNDEVPCEQDENFLEDSEGENDDRDEVTDDPLQNTREIENLIKGADEELYPGCKTFSKLSFLVH